MKMNNLSCNPQGEGTTLPVCSVAKFSVDTGSAFLHGTALPKEHFFGPGAAAEQLDVPGCVPGVGSAAGW